MGHKPPNFDLKKCFQSKSISSHSFHPNFDLKYDLETRSDLKTFVRSDFLYRVQKISYGLLKLKYKNALKSIFVIFKNSSKNTFSREAWTPNHTVHLKKSSN